MCNTTAAQTLCQQRDQRFINRILFIAESAAQIRFHHTDISHRYSQRIGCISPNGMRSLVACINYDLSSVHVSKTTVVFQMDCVDRGCMKLFSDKVSSSGNLRRGAEFCAAEDRLTVRNREIHTGKFVIGPDIMQYIRSIDRVTRCQQRFMFFIFNTDKLCCQLCMERCIRNNCRNVITKVAYMGCENMFILYILMCGVQ